MSPVLSLHTPIIDLHKYRIAHLGQTTSRKLSTALAVFAKKAPPETTVEDLLSYLPMRYEDRSNLADLKDLREGLEVSLELYVKLAGGYQVGRKRRRYGVPLYIFEISATDLRQMRRPVVVWWFVSGAHARDIISYYTKRLTRGTRFITYGKWLWDKRRGTYAAQLNKPGDELELLPELNGDAKIDQSQGDADPDSELFSDPSLNAIHVGRPVPIYRKLGDLPSKRLREIIHVVLSSIPESDFHETLPPRLRQRQDLVDRRTAFRLVHFPPAGESLVPYEQARSPAHRRLIFEDFFWVAMRIALMRGERTAEVNGLPIKIDQGVKHSIASIMPFKLTGAQRRVVAEIFRDMQSGIPMNRLLQGDVGSGKTVVALVSMMAAMENGYQTALMAPTEILAEQHARTIKAILAQTPYRVELLTGSLQAGKKRTLYAELADGQIQACIGTHALIQEPVTFANLGLVVIDEQHRFGVMQRAELRARGFNPNVLVMTATPIPRSLAMTVYGDLDVSIIDEMPPGRTPIETKVFGEEQRREVKLLIEREVEAGRQVYVVYPLVEESEKMDLRDATQRYEYLKTKVFKKFSVGLLHGRMKPAEKEAVMRQFLSGQVQILVSTTVVEVGVDVPNASLMVVEHADRFGLSQLHQLRGRVGRGAERSYCLLLSDNRTNIAEQRLGILAKTSNGFVIAERDLELRGPGELLGTKQSGLPEFSIANLVRDQQILEQAKLEADHYLTKRRESIETARMIEWLDKENRFRLAAVG